MQYHLKLNSKHYSKTQRISLLPLRDALALDNEPLEAWVSITLIAPQNTLLYLSFWAILRLFTPSRLTKTYADATCACGTETTFWRETFLVCRVNTSLVTHSVKGFQASDLPQNRFCACTSSAAVYRNQVNVFKCWWYKFEKCFSEFRFRRYFLNPIKSTLSSNRNLSFSANGSNKSSSFSRPQPLQY